MCLVTGFLAICMVEFSLLVRHAILYIQLNCHIPNGIENRLFFRFAVTKFNLNSLICFRFQKKNKRKSFHTDCPVAINLNSTTIPLIRTLLQLVNNSVQALRPLLQRLLGDDLVSINDTTICLARNLSSALGGLLGGNLGDVLGGLLG